MLKCSWSNDSQHARNTGDVRRPHADPTRKIDFLFKLLFL